MFVCGSVGVCVGVWSRVSVWYVGAWVCGCLCVCVFFFKKKKDFSFFFQKFKRLKNFKSLTSKTPVEFLVFSFYPKQKTKN